MRTTKPLKAREFKYADGRQMIYPHAVVEDGKRIGTVMHVVCDNGVQWYDPFRRADGKSGDGKVVTKDYMIQRQKTFAEALAVI